MLEQQTWTEKPYRVGVYPSMAEADRVVRELLAAGFTRDELAIVCADDKRAQAPAGIEVAKPTEEYTMKAIGVGGAVGATLGGIALAATALATGGVGLLAAGSVLVGGGAIGGSFVGAMSTRAFEPEIANYYEQALQAGQVVVAVELHGEGNQARLARAEQVLARKGRAEPVALVEG